MTTKLIGYHSWSMDIDDVGRRTYKLLSQVQSDSLADGPYTVYNTTGVPKPGWIWSFQNDDDIWAFCLYTARVWSMQSKEQDPTYWWLVESHFSTLPQVMRCGSSPTGDPASEPQKVDYAFNKLTKEATYDLNHKLIANSAFEPIKGNTVEFDYNRVTVTIEQYSYHEPISTFTDYIDSVNNDELWGQPARSIKLSNVSGPRYVYGPSLAVPYWVTKLEFEVESTSDLTFVAIAYGLGGWDRIVPDYGTRVINGRWNTQTGDWIPEPFPGYSEMYPGRPNPDPDNPAHFRALKDIRGIPMKGPLNGYGYPAFNGSSGSTTDVGEIYVQYYPSKDFLELGIPTDLSDPCQ